VKDKRSKFEDNEVSHTRWWGGQDRMSGRGKGRGKESGVNNTLLSRTICSNTRKIGTFLNVSNFKSKTKKDGLEFKKRSKVVTNKRP
jgi:hypothetical protein